MALDQPVFENTASYYNSAAKKWVSGTFTLKENFFQFQNDDSNNQGIVRIPLSTISGLEKRQSSFIYAAIVITIGSEKHWFASFSNRDTVYNLLELFWRESLLSKTYKTSPPRQNVGATPLGKELIGILHESESSLVNAANELVNQGRQIQESQMVIEDINTDLNVAEKFLRTFNFVQNFLKVKDPELKVEGKSVQNEGLQKHFKVTYTFSKSTSKSWEKGTLIVSDEIVLLDERQNRLIVVERNDLIEFQVTAPWEFCMLYNVGNEWCVKDCYFMCPQLSRLLKFLNSLKSFKPKITYIEEDPVEDGATCSGSTSMDYMQKTPSPIEVIKARSNLINSTAAQAQLLTDDGVISDEDMEEISNVLANLQVLATEVSQEQKNQMEQINSLITDVEKTELRMKADIKNIKKAT
ncbi:synaptosomal-associated protein 47 [Nephila pilipes]|uniref:Synaptosomal-associated protein 47 n=1 Tax=Nephila pilipes TaxID=299642 RepID=A0A8X6N246_NEPPI|nr:synaptosomal-associated protein 47 [Nephila pilipes]